MREARKGRQGRRAFLVRFSHEGNLSIFLIYQIAHVRDAPGERPLSSQHSTPIVGRLPFEHGGENKEKRADVNGKIGGESVIIGK